MWWLSLLSQGQRSGLSAAWWGPRECAPGAAADGLRVNRPEMGACVAPAEGNWVMVVLCKAQSEMCDQETDTSWNLRMTARYGHVADCNATANRRRLLQEGYNWVV